MTGVARFRGRRADDRNRLEADAFAKVNLSLSVGSVDHTGYHPIRSVVTSVDWSDRLTVTVGHSDGVSVAGADLPEDHRNLAWQAMLAARDRAASDLPVQLSLAKAIPVAAGLGGGSADAAAALGVGQALFEISPEDAAAIAAELGADVPFCLTGGFAIIEGRGEQVTPLPSAAGFALAVVVPPVECSTAAVYRAWDQLGGPTGRELPRADSPDVMRRFEPVRNDLLRAAIAVAPSLSDWLVELEHRWGRGVALSGSGSALYAFFAALDEAEEAVIDVPTGARAARAVVPVPRGWRLVGEDASD